MNQNQVMKVTFSMEFKQREMRKKMQKNQLAKTWFFQKINKINKPLAKVTQNKNEANISVTTKSVSAHI